MAHRVKANATGLLPVVGRVFQSGGAVGPFPAVDSECSLTVTHTPAGLDVLRSDADEVKPGRWVVHASCSRHSVLWEARFAVDSDARGTGRSRSKGVGGIASQTQPLCASTAQYAHFPSWIVSVAREPPVPLPA